VKLIKKKHNAFRLGVGKARMALQKNETICLQKLDPGLDMESEQAQVAIAEMDGWNSIVQQVNGRSAYSGDKGYDDETERQLAIPFLKYLTAKTRHWLLYYAGIKTLKDCAPWNTDTIVFYKGFAVHPDLVNKGKYSRVEKLPLECLMELRIAMGVNKHFSCSNSNRTSMEVLEQSLQLLRNSGYIAEQYIVEQHAYSQSEKNCISSGEDHIEIVKRYTEVIKLSQEGLSKPQIAAKLKISTATVGNYRRRHKENNPLVILEEWTCGLDGELISKLKQFGYQCKSDCLKWVESKLVISNDFAFEPGSTNVAEDEKATHKLSREELNRLRKWLGLPPLTIRFLLEADSLKRDLNISIYIATRNGYKLTTPCGETMMPVEHI
jgi:hypothetical protein